MKRYAFVLAGALVAAVVLGVLGRAPRSRATHASASAAVRTDSLRIVFRDGVASPATASVPEGRRLALTLANEGGRFLTVTLAGYEDRVPPAPLGPGATHTVTFLADRPGEAFAFLVDGEPSGRLAVTGSHLPEGHR